MGERDENQESFQPGKQGLNNKGSRFRFAVEKILQRHFYMCIEWRGVSLACNFRKIK